MTPSWSGNQWKSSQSIKQAKLEWKTLIYSWVSVRFTIYWDRIKRLDLLYNASHTSVLIRSLLPEALICVTLRNEKNQRYFNEKCQYIHWVLVLFTIYFDRIQALDRLYNWLHTIILNWPLFLEALVSLSKRTQRDVKKKEGPGDIIKDKGAGQWAHVFLFIHQWPVLYWELLNMRRRKDFSAI